MANADSMADQAVTVSIPARCARRFYAETLDELSMAAENVMEGVKWLRSRDALDRLEEADLPRMREADEIFSQVVGGLVDERYEPFEVRAPQTVLASLLRSCARGAVDAISDEADDGWSSDAMRGLAGELTVWLDLVDGAGLPTIQGREGAA